MKKIKTLVLTGLITVGAFSLIAYTSCKKDECKDVVCKNNGTCVDGTCECPTGYEGPQCETVSNQKFLGVYTAVDNCPLGTRSGADLEYTLSIIPDNQDPLKVTVIGLANTPSAYVFTATVNGDKLTIAEQTMADSRTYSGTITYQDAHTLNMSFKITENGQPVEACSSVLTK